MNEQAVLLGKSNSLVGIITPPPEAVQKKRNTAMIFLNAGLVHRIGPNRLYVHLARRLAGQGFLSVRFDFSGIGGSPPGTGTESFAQRAIRETREVMDSICERTGISNFCLIGLCSGAIVAFRTAGKDSRVAAAIMLNARGIAVSTAWDRSAESSWQIRDYWKKLFIPRSLLSAVKKTFTGNSEPYRRLFNAIRNRLKHRIKAQEEFDTVANDLAEDIHTLIERQIHLLWVCSDGDPSVEYLKMIASVGHADLRDHKLIRQMTINGANHTFDSLSSQKKVLNQIETWASDCLPASK